MSFPRFTKNPGPVRERDLFRAIVDVIINDDDDLGCPASDAAQQVANPVCFRTGNHTYRKRQWFHQGLGLAVQEVDDLDRNRGEPQPKCDPEMYSHQEVWRTKNSAEASCRMNAVFRQASERRIYAAAKDFIVRPRSVLVMRQPRPHYPPHAVKQNDFSVGPEVARRAR